MVLDELHLMLRITGICYNTACLRFYSAPKIVFILMAVFSSNSTDKLTDNFVKDALEWDKKENLDKPSSQTSDKHLQALIKAVKSCGISFSVWEKLNGDGKGSGLYDFTSLMGSDKKIMLKKLPGKLDGVIRPEISATVIRIWRV